MAYTEDEIAREKRFKRIRLIKKILRPMPRKSNVHRYPVLKYFAGTIRKRAYLWEFRSRRNVLAGIWIGWFIALIPIYSIQMIVAFIICIPLKGNALIAMALQWITNPLTIVPILYGQYRLGDFVYRFLGGTPSNLDIFAAMKEDKLWEVLKTQTNLDVILHMVFSVLGGGAIISVIGAAIMSGIYILISDSRKSRLEAAKVK